MGLFKKWRAKRAAKKQLKAEKKVQEDKVQDEKVVEKSTQEQKTVKQPKTVEQPKVVKKETPIEESGQEDEYTPNEEIKEDSKESDRLAKYHVSQNKDTNSAYYKQWRVRKSGSAKTIKYFKTQKEAIEYAEDLAEKAGTSIVIHKVDGHIRKQNYRDKE